MAKPSHMSIELALDCLLTNPVSKMNFNHHHHHHHHHHVPEGLVMFPVP